MLADLVGAIPKHLTRLGLARSLRGRGPEASDPRHVVGAKFGRI